MFIDTFKSFSLTFYCCYSVAHHFSTFHNINNSLHLARNYARIFVRGHYLRTVFRECSSRKTVSFEEQIMSKDRVHYQEPATPIISQCNDIFIDQTIFRYFSREIGQFQSIWALIGKDKTLRPHMNISTWCPYVDISPCLWLHLVTEVPVVIWIGNNFKLKLDRSVKTSWKEYGVVAGS